MSPSIAFLGGLVLVWIVASGRANAVWQAITRAAPSANPNTPSPPSNVPGLTPGVPPGSRDPIQPPTTA